MLRRAASVRFLGALAASVAMLVWLAAGGSAAKVRVSTLSIGKGINAVFDTEQKQTTYSLPTVTDDLAGAKCCTYAWTLTISAPDGQVDPSLGVDPGCDNHGTLSGTGPTFTWQHANKGDKPRDDGCDHKIYGKYGHQGLISVTVSDDQGWECSATYKGTLSNDQNTALGQQAASTPTCTGPTITPPPPRQPCKCDSLILAVAPSSLHLGEITFEGKAHDVVAFTVAWKLRCTRGSGGGCEASYTALAAELKSGKHSYRTYFFFKDKTGQGIRIRDRVLCRGSCSRTKSGKVLFQVVLLSGLDPIARSDESIPIVIRRDCQDRTIAPKKLSIHFDSRGEIDRAQSKLS